MGFAFELGKGVVVAYQSDGLGVTDFVDDVDAVSGFFDAEAAACQDFLILLNESKYCN